MDSKNNMMKLKDRFNRMKKKEDQDYYDMFKEFIDMDKQMNLAREEIFTNGARTNKVFKVELPREKLKEDLKKYVTATFLSIFRPDLKVTIPGQEPTRRN